MLSMKHKLQLMQWVVSFNEGEETPTSTQELVDAAAKSLGMAITVADLKEACKNADMKWSAICSTGTSPVALLHIKVAELLADRNKLQAQLNEMKQDLNAMRHQIRTLNDKLSYVHIAKV